MEILGQSGCFGITEDKGVAHSFSVCVVSLTYLLGAGERSGIGSSGRWYLNFLEGTPELSLKK